MRTTTPQERDLQNEFDRMREDQERAYQCDRQESENEFVRLRRIEQAARRLLEIMDAEQWRWAASTFTTWGRDCTTAVYNLRAALDDKSESE